MTDAISVTLGSLYEPNLWDLRKRVAQARRARQPLIFAELRVPINSDVVHLALRTEDLYLVGIRGRTSVWYEFEPDIERSSPGSGPGKPMLPGSRRIKVGNRNALSSYGALHLPQLIATRQNRYAEMPTALVAFFSNWDGQINIDYTRLRVCVLTFIISEALRFRSIETIARNWLSPSPHQPAGIWPVFEITKEMLERARSWKDGAQSGDPDVQTWLPGMPDKLID